MQSWVSLLLRLRSIINTQIVEPPTYVCNSMISAGHPAEQPPLYHVANIRKQQTNAGVPLPPSPCEAVWTQTRRRKTAQCPPLSLENKTSRSFKRKDRVATETQPATPPPPDRPSEPTPPRQISLPAREYSATSVSAAALHCPPTIWCYSLCPPLRPAIVGFAAM